MIKKMQEPSSLFHPLSIGKVKLTSNLFLAPMAGFTDAAFRSLCKDYGASLTYTEMVSSEALIRGNKNTLPLLKRADNEDKIAVQLFGSEASVMQKAIDNLLMTIKPSIIDINAACPVKKIVKQGAGCALMQDTKKLALIIKTMRTHLDSLALSSLPLTIKIRLGMDDKSINYLDVAKVAIDNGCSAITLHGRTGAQGYSGKARWEDLTSLVKMVKTYDKENKEEGVKIIGSGDLFLPEDVKRMLEETGCDAVMIARGARGRPFIFRQTQEYLLTGSYKEVSVKEKIDAAKKELLLLCQNIGEERGCLEGRKRVLYYLSAIKGSAKEKVKIVKAATLEEYDKILNIVLKNATD